MTDDAPRKRLTGPQKTLIQLSLVGLLMLSLSFAAVPFYNWFCRTTGFAGTTQVAEGASDVVLDTPIDVYFDGSLERGMPWQFKPMQTKMTLRIGETALAFYEAYNPTDRPIAGTASYNVSPEIAGAYFIKIDCFCFTEQILKPGERVQMPVTFYVDPDIVKDPEAKFIQHITLSYTFHETELPADQAAADPARTPVN